jgi:hypothetical protein
VIGQAWGGFDVIFVTAVFEVVFVLVPRGPCLLLGAARVFLLGSSRNELSGGGWVNVGEDYDVWGGRERSATARSSFCFSSLSFLPYC